VADPGQPCVVQIEAWLNHDLEPGYDYLTLVAFPGNGTPLDLWTADGQAVNLHLEENIVFNPGDYTGEDGNQVHLRFQVKSDVTWSDEDCLFPTTGACQIDDIRVTLDNGGTDSFSDFEDDSPGDWMPIPGPHVGDFTQLWTHLADIDPCVDNFTSQVAFIDDGVVVPGTGGSFCLDWCYGPDGFVVNCSGGLAGPDDRLYNIIESPVIDISSLAGSGFLLEYDAYSHEDLDWNSPGIFHIWHVRSTASPDPAAIESAPWTDLSLLYWGRGYKRWQRDLTPLIVPGARYIQVALGVKEYRTVWVLEPLDPTPAPYYDNVRLSAFPLPGPSLWTMAYELAQDAFPEAGTLDPLDPAADSVRFDMARSQVVPGQDLTVAGDSIVCRVIPAPDGATLTGPPLLHYRLLPNPAFAACRTSGLPDEGTVAGWPALGPVGVPVPNLFAFDLPDTGFLFPGDLLHYFISATDETGGQERTALLPADTTGFSLLNGFSLYDPLFTVRALPAVQEVGGNLVRNIPILFWNDGGPDGLAEWWTAFKHCGLSPGNYFDVYSTNDPEANEGNGLGQKTTLDLLAGYSTVLYAGGPFPHDTLVEADVRLLDQWLELADKHLLLTGDGVLSDLKGGTDVSQQFLADKVGLQVLDVDLRPMIGNQYSPRVRPVGGSVLPGDMTWIAHGGCPDPRAFDAVLPVDGTARVAAFTNPAGIIDFDFCAAALRQDQGMVFSLPYAFEAVWTGQPDNLHLPTRSRLLRWILYIFGENIYLPTAASDTPALRVSSSPNPFNPSTTISYSLPQEEHLGIRIYDLHGRLVKTLMDKPMPAGPGHIAWDGTDSRGGQVASGVYFCEVRAGGEVRVQKMALIK